MSKFKLGKLPARKDAVIFRLKEYGAKLPSPPSAGGHTDLIHGDDNMFANDKLGDCVCAEAAHGTLYYNREAGKTIKITDDYVIAMYSAVTGYSPLKPDSDQGTDMQAAASWRRKTGLKDVNGNVHKIAAYLALTKGNERQLRQAIHYFGGAGIGFQFPDYAMDQFNAGKPWAVQKGDDNIEGGHDVFAYAYNTAYIYCISWGKPVKMTWGFYAKYCDEALAYLSPEALKDGKSLEGFDLPTLTKDLAALK